MSTYYPGQRIIASDGATYTLTHFAEGLWWGERTGAARLPQPVTPRYPAWGGDDDRAGADQARNARPRRVRSEQSRARQARKGSPRRPSRLAS